ncbi:hypothetical protein Rhopal_007796-T1 [Rhodotorula paludigena]|uniref:GH26 domain-containing protein n=1 Tax=Rhodotorula paludigena TaxID=86838 RepID=A0AAV5GXK2_9BASI|nr:hypothetical protein Rhopal_007796-T1 [Rhodotorula paludigena]
MTAGRATPIHGREAAHQCVVLCFLAPPAPADLPPHARQDSFDDRDDDPYSRFSRASSDDDAPPPTRTTKQTRSCILLFCGIAIAIVLVLLGALALWKFYGKEDGGGSVSGGGGGAVTVTETEAGRVVTKTVSTGAAKPTSGGGGGSDGADDEQDQGEGSAGGTGSGSTGGGSGQSSWDTGILPGLSRNGIGIGFLPDYKVSNMKQITEGLGIHASFYGWYAQLPESGDWDGGQLLSQMDDVKACKCIFQPAVMPTKGWNGLTKEENYQALAIAKVMKRFTDEGIEVWLRFAHEINWYLSDGTYQGTKEQFKEAWGVVAEAVADNTLVKMFFTPNIAGSFQDYVDHYPDDPATVHYLGLDFYPRGPDEKFLPSVQEMYDKWCADGSTKFAMGETGVMYQNVPMEQRLHWLDELTSEETAKAMPHYVGVSWFNYDKETKFHLFLEGDDTVNSATKEWLAANNVVAEGGKAGNA